MWIYLLIGGAAAAAAAAVLRWRRRRAADDDAPMISLVLLLAEPRPMDLPTLTDTIERAWSVWLDRGSPDATEFVVGEKPTFVVKIGDGEMYLVHVFDRPYVDDVDAAAELIRELRLRDAFRRHRAWLSVDRLGAEECTEQAAAYRRIGKLVAALADDDCLAIWCPETEQMNVWSDELKEALSGPEPLAAFAGENVNVPVVQVDDDSPEMKAAVAEAGGRWPEFLSAFESRREDQMFSVKAPISDGEHTEFMWVNVTAIENDVIFGLLGNDPVSVTGIQAGDRVRVELGDLNDWVYTEGERLIGGFTIEVLKRAQGEQ